MDHEQDARALREAWRQTQADRTDMLAESQRLRAVVAQTGKQIHLLEDYLQAAGQVAMFGHFEIDTSHHVTLSGSACELLDSSARNHDNLDAAFARASEGDRARLIAGYENLLTESKQIDMEIGLQLLNGGIRWLRVVVRRAHQSDFATFGLLLDITDAKLNALRRDVILQVSQVLLQEADSEDAYRGTLQSAGNGLGWDLGACWLLAPNRRKLHCLAVWASANAGLQPLVDVMQGRVLDAGTGMLGQVIESGREIWSSAASADTRFAEHKLLAGLGVTSAYTLPIITEDGRCAGVLQFLSRQIRAEDRYVTEIGRLIGTLLAQRARREEAIQQLRNAAERDSLTGLYSRYALSKQIEQLINADSAAAFAVCVLDLDRFKLVNQGMGQEAGDLVLMKTANRLAGVAGASCHATRLGGDEFAIVIGDASSADRVVAEVVQSLSESFLIEDCEFNLSVSVGLSRFPEDGAEPDSLIREADIRRIRTKRPAATGSLASVRSPLDQLRTAREFRSALEGDGITVHYQPIIDFRSHAIAGFEALVRWRHPDRGILLPGFFLDVAEEAGLMRNVSARVIETVTRDIAQAAEWLPPDWRFNINLTALDFRDFKLFKSLGNVLTRAGVGPQRLRFEITESTLMEDMVNAERVIGLFTGYGVEFAIDDFGTGFSSLAQLSRLPVHEIKIDGSFTRGINTVRGDAVVRAILDLAARLGMPVTAEGVETATQAAVLTGYGCAKGQGYLFSRAMPFGELRNWVDEFSVATARAVEVE